MPETSSPPLSPSELTALKQADPVKYWIFMVRLMQMSGTAPDVRPLLAEQIQTWTQAEYTEFIVLLAKHTPEDVRAENKRAELRRIAAERDDMRSYLAYHELIHGTPPLEHEPIAQAFEARERGVEFIELGFRGSHKTTTFDVTLGSFLLGHHPDKTGIVTGANDDNAKAIAKSIAQIIENHPEFKKVFPHVVIYKDRGWGADGYWVRDDQYDIEEWTQKQAKVNDSSFVGGGYKSSVINGKHPSLFLFIDDLHDIDSSKSRVERESIKQVFLLQILPTVLRENDRMTTWVIITGVPFSKDDTYHVMKDGGGCVFVEVPVMRKAADEAEGAVYVDGKNKNTGVVYEDIVGWWYLTWAENFGPDTIIYWRSKGKSTFWQMFMVNIEKARTSGLKYYLYPHDKLNFELPTSGGADPTTLDPDYEVGGQKRSSFALCYLCKVPTGQLVVKGGVLKPMGMFKALEALRQAQSIFKNWLGARVEGVGVGKAFQQVLRQHPDIRWIDSNIANPQGRIKDKKTRFEYEVSPWLDNAILLISDDENDYNMALRDLCENFFEIDPNKPDERLDAGDGLYHALKNFPEVLRMLVPETMNPTENSNTQRRGLYHPLANMGAN